MSEVILYQSVLQKLGQLSPKELFVLDNFLSKLLPQSAENSQPRHGKRKKKPVASLFGAWADWDEKEFQEFLNYNAAVRNDIFSTRDLQL